MRGAPADRISAAQFAAVRVLTDQAGRGESFCDASMRQASNVLRIELFRLFAASFVRFCLRSYDAIKLQRTSKQAARVDRNLSGARLEHRRVSIDDVPDAYEMFEHTEDDCSKVVVEKAH